MCRFQKVGDEQKHWLSLENLHVVPVTVEPNVTTRGSFLPFCAQIHLFHAPLPPHVAPCLSLNLPDQRNIAWAGGGRPQPPPGAARAPTAASQPPALRGR